MAEGKRVEEWDHTAEIMALLYNVNCEKTRSPIDFHPFKEYENGERPTVGVQVLKFLIPAE